MSSVAAWLERWLLALICAGAAVGIAWPTPGRHVVDGHGITIALIVLVAAVGLGLDAAAVVAARRRAARVTVMLIVPLLGLPLIAYAASRTVPAGPLRLGVLAAGVAPSEVASVALAALAGGSIALAALAGGSIALSACVLIGSTLVCVALAGPALHLLASSDTTFSSTSLLLSLVGIVAAPLLVAACVRTRLPNRTIPGADSASSAIATIAVLVLIWLVASQAHLGLAYLHAAAALLLFLLGSVLLAAILTIGLPRDTKVSLLLPVAMRDFAIAAGIATQAFGAAASAPLGIYGVLVLLFGAAFARHTSRTSH